MFIVFQVGLIKIDLLEMHRCISQ